MALLEVPRKRDLGVEGVGISKAALKSALRLSRGRRLEDLGSSVLRSSPAHIGRKGSLVPKGLSILGVLCGGHSASAAEGEVGTGATAVLSLSIQGDSLMGLQTPLLPFTGSSAL